jgi:Zn-finger nucleic acid-binding protein
VAFRPERVRIEGHELVCPACSTLMPARQVSGVGLNECLACHGLWAPDDSFDLLVGRAIEARQQASAAELQQLRPRATGSNPSRQSVRYRNCPECDAQMHRSNYRKTSGVIIDSCAEHGIWLDADELEQIAGFLLSGAAGERPTADSAARRRQRAASAEAVARATLPLELSRLDRTASAAGHSGSAVESVVNLLCKILK